MLMMLTNLWMHEFFGSRVSYVAIDLTKTNCDIDAFLCSLERTKK